MKCECCGRNKKIFESFESVRYKKLTIHICVSCSQILYKLRGADNSDMKAKEQLLKELAEKSKAATPNFEIWKENFLQKLNNPQN